MKTPYLVVVISVAAIAAWLIYTKPSKEDHGNSGSGAARTAVEAEKSSNGSEATAHEKRMRDAGNSAIAPTNSNNAPTADPTTSRATAPPSIARVPSGQRTGTVTAEQSLLRPGGVFDGGSLSSTIRSGQFSKFVDALRSQSGSSPLATDINQMYGDAISEQVGKLGNEIQLRDFACGETICAGTIDSSSQNAWGAWLKDNASDPRTKAYVFTEHQIDNGNGSVEHRFIFSTDPGSKKISVTGGE